CSTRHFVFFFQAEDGIRDFHVTGVQTCALPILSLNTSNRITAVRWGSPAFEAGLTSGWDLVAVNGRAASARGLADAVTAARDPKIGRASCRERAQIAGCERGSGQQPL